MSKKDAATMDRERKIFIHGLEENGEVKVKGAVRNGVDAKIAEQIFNQMESFAQYAFNKSHAAAYAVVGYQTAYLKKYHPAEFMAANLNSFLGNFDKAAAYVLYCRNNGIKVIPPDINKSFEKFTVEGNLIRFGLAAIKNLGLSAVQAIVKEREKGPFKSFLDFCERIGVTALNKRAVESLIMAGAFDAMGYKRSQLAASYERLMNTVSERKKRISDGQMQLFDMLDTDSEPAEDLPDLEEYSKNVLLAMEKEMLGVFVSGHPLDEYAQELSGYKYNTAMLSDDENGFGKITDNEWVEMAGIISAKKDKATKNGGIMSFITLEDLYGSVEVLVFPTVLSRYSNLLVPDMVVSIKGRISTREEEAPKLIAESVTRLRPAQKSQYDKIWVRLPYKDARLYDEICSAARQNPGESELLFYFEDTRTTGRCNIGVNIDKSLLAKLAEIAGAENVKPVG